MRIRSRTILGASIGSALALCACESPAPTPPAAEAIGACTRLAREFLQIAERRDRGDSRESQIELAHDRADDPSTPNPNATRRYLLQTIGFVYRRPDLTAARIEARVLAGCLVNDEGRAVLYLPQR